MHQSTSQSLLLGPNRFFNLAQQCFLVLGFDASAGLGARIRFPSQEIAAAITAIPSHLVSAQDETGEGVAGIADAGDVPPSVGRVAGMNADTVAVDTAD